MFRQFGSIIGVGIFGSVQSGLYDARFRSLANQPGLANSNGAPLRSSGSVTLDFQQAADLGGPTGDAMRRVASLAYEAGMLGSFAVAAAVIAVTLGIVALLSRSASRRP